MVTLTFKSDLSSIGLFSEDFSSQKRGSYGPGDKYTDNLKSMIPSYLPLGHYKLRFTVHGPNTDVEIYACLYADFDIYAYDENRFQIPLNWSKNTSVCRLSRLGTAELSFILFSYILIKGNVKEIIRLNLL